MNKPTAAMLPTLLKAHGVKIVFASPGSRNAPLLTAISASDLSLEMVVDERSAAFMALGYSDISRQPVALVCTSGTALLNYLPAIAEAHYRHLPLIVVSADRPAAWIDQDDSQTLHQPGALRPYIKVECDLPDNPEPSSTDLWLANREINNALIAATRLPMGPVHINMRFDAPLGATAPDIDARVIDTVAPGPMLTTRQARDLGLELASPRKVLIVCGFMPPSQKITRAMRRLAELPNVAVLAENTANIHAPNVYGRIDNMLTIARNEGCLDTLRPDVVISCGGALVSRKLKEFLRNTPPQEHWQVGPGEYTVDCFKCLTRRVMMTPEEFLPQLASAMQPLRDFSAYSVLWHSIAAKVEPRMRAVIDAGGWSAMAAFDYMVEAMPGRCNVQCSNGTSIRYLQLLDCTNLHRIDCNRGVSGIDGSTSTAVGAHLAAPHAPTVLFTGDMSLQYDLTALGTAQVTPNLKVVVIDNGGGGIFRFIPSTKDLEALEECFVMPRPYPFKALAQAWGWSVWEADDMASLKKYWPRFIAGASTPAMLIVHTDGEHDTRVLNNLLESSKY